MMKRSRCERFLRSLNEDAEHFIADPPEFDAVRLWVTVGCTNAPHWCRGGAICIFDLLRGGPRVSESGIHRDIRLYFKEAAERDKFLRADSRCAVP